MGYSTVCVKAAAIAVACVCMVSGSVLDTARALGNGKYAGWTYGPDTSEQKVDCTQFLVSVAEEHLQLNLDQQARNEINIATIHELEGLNDKQKNTMLGVFILDEDPRTKGVQHALVSRGMGSKVDLDDIREGDLVQYWIKRDSGWFGHAAVVERIRENGSTRRMKLYGAHKSINKVGSSLDKNDIVIKHNDTDRKIYVVRLD